jgi:hypothetical protein
MLYKKTITGTISALIKQGIKAESNKFLAVYLTTIIKIQAMKVAPVPKIMSGRPYIDIIFPKRQPNVKPKV